MNGQLPELGAIGVAMACVLALFETVKRFLPPRNGNDVKLECPNKIYGINTRLAQMDSNIKHTLDAVKTSMAGIDTLVRQHAAGPDGVERFKISPRLEKVIEETGEHQREMLEVQKRIANDMQELVKLYKKNGNGGTK